MKPKPLRPFNNRCDKCGDFVYHDEAGGSGRTWMKAGKSKIVPEEHVVFRCACGYSWRCKIYKSSQETKE